MLHDAFHQEHRFWHHDYLIGFVAWFDNAEQRGKNETIKGKMAETDLPGERDKVVTKPFKSNLKLIWLELARLISPLFNLDIVVLILHFRHLFVLIVWLHYCIFILHQVSLFSSIFISWCKLAYPPWRQWIYVSLLTQDEDLPRMSGCIQAITFNSLNTACQLEDPTFSVQVKLICWVGKCIVLH